MSSIRVSPKASRWASNWPVAERSGAHLDFRTLVADHVLHAAGRHVYAGIGNHNVNIDQAIHCIEVAREVGAQGIVLFDYSLFKDHMERFREGVFATPARIPEMPWRTEAESTRNQMNDKR